MARARKKVMIIVSNRVLTDLSRTCMRDIIGIILTRISITTLLLHGSERHLKMKSVAYFSSRGEVTHSSFSDTGSTNHTEGKTAINMGLRMMSLLDKRVVVFGNDVDIFVLLLAHYEFNNCSVQQKFFAARRRNLFCLQ